MTDAEDSSLATMEWEMKRRWDDDEEGSNKRHHKDDTTTAGCMIEPETNAVPPFIPEDLPPGLPPSWYSGQEKNSELSNHANYYQSYQSSLYSSHDYHEGRYYRNSTQEIQVNTHRQSPQRHSYSNHEMDRNQYSQNLHGMGRGRRPTLPAWHTRKNSNGILATRYDTDSHYQGSTANNRDPNPSIENYTMDYRGQAASWDCGPPARHLGMGRGRSRTLPSWYIKQNGNTELSSQLDNDSEYQSSTATEIQASKALYETQPYTEGNARSLENRPPPTNQTSRNQESQQVGMGRGRSRTLPAWYTKQNGDNDLGNPSGADSNKLGTKENPLCIVDVDSDCSTNVLVHTNSKEEFTQTKSATTAMTTAESYNSTKSSKPKIPQKQPRCGPSRTCIECKKPKPTTRAFPDIAVDLCSKCKKTAERLRSRRTCTTCQNFKAEHHFPDPAAESCSKCQSSRNCSTCQELKSEKSFPNKDAIICKFCQNLSPRVCSTCKKHKPEAYFPNVTADICSKCDKKHQNANRECNTCNRRKPGSQFTADPAADVCKKCQKQSVGPKRECSDCKTVKSGTQFPHPDPRFSSRDDVHVRICTKCLKAAHKKLKVETTKQKQQYLIDQHSVFCTACQRQPVDMEIPEASEEAHFCWDCSNKATTRSQSKKEDEA
jgi:hypothetical protein